MIHELERGPVLTKGQMYRMLESGCFGNTIKQWTDVRAWWYSEERKRYSQWGVRTSIPGGPCRLFCPTGEVLGTYLSKEFLNTGPVISIMIDPILNVSLWADIYDSDTGIQVYGIENPPKGASWRKLMPSEGRTWKGIEARCLLRTHLNSNSLSDLETLFERYPGHVVELSACDRCFGTVPGRNAVTWECRFY